MMKTAFASLIGFAVSAALLAANSPAEQGKDVFAKRCSGCHDLDRDKEGPRLRGVFGRTAGKVATFSYSDGLKAAAFTWDKALLDKWLTNPDSVVKDTDMAFHLENASEREQVIAWLRSLSQK
ncbi:MAG TPA: c-type cytochrome [Bryobacteraceae bacterium]|nr:c-type cytochrome [Bryobacteraceae bacterium]